MATSQEVSWTMPARLKGQRVQYRTVGGPIASAKASRRPATKKATSGTTRPRYEATLTGLTPATAYQYRVVTRWGASSWRTFTTANPAATTTTLIALGDTQVDNRGVPRRTIRRALAEAPQASLVLQAGDVVNKPTSLRQWDDLFAAIGTSGRTRNWLVSIGNHEQCVLTTCESNAGEAFRSYFDWPTNGFPDQGETWFFVDHEGVRIVVLDSFGGRMPEQAQFLDQALASNPNRWSIVLMHAPPFASQPDRPNPDVVAQWLPILEARNVDLVLTGHDHSYVRGYYRRANGPVYVTSVSGPKYYDVTDADWVANKATRVSWAAGTSTYQVITIAGEQLTYRAVVSARGATSTSPFGPGGVLDQFTIDKAGGRKVVR
jgi:3',5'-cyclic AMP phosphodiesterase CpdA